MNLELAKSIIYFLVEGKQSIYKTKMNKLLFYTQFLYAKTYANDLLKVNFIKDYYGPVVENFNTELNDLAKNNIIKLEDTGYGTQIFPKVKFERELYSEKELTVLNKVLSIFEGYTASQISDESHQESLWKDTKLKDIIPLSKAKELSLNL